MYINKNIKNITKFINSKKYKNYKILYHITTENNAKNILKNNFNIKKSKNHSFGIGINMTDNIKHLKYYQNKKLNSIIVCLVKYNKLKFNPTYYDNINCKESIDYIKKYGYSRPTYLKAPKNYNGFVNDDIYVIKNNKYIYPILYYKISK